MDVKVTVIMPSYNVKEYIQEAIESVIGQSLKEIEILCIDAGSNDGTVEIIKKYSEIDSRIKYVNSEIKSYGHQLNLGIDMASGEYIGIVETDDYVDSEMFKNLYELAQKDHCDFVKADYMAFITQDDGAKFFLKRRNFIKDDLYYRVLVPKNYSEVAFGDWYNCQGIYNREFIVKNHIRFSETPGAAFQDIGFLFYAIILANRAEYTKDYYYRYRIDREGSSSNSGRGIKYSYDEFSRLVELAEDDDRIGNHEYKVMYCRMVKSFISSYQGLDRNALFEKDDAREKYYSWFKDQIEKAINNGIIIEEDFGENAWNVLMLFLNSEVEMLDFISDNKAKIKKILDSNKNSQVVVFGCGNYGYEAHVFLRKINRVNVGFADNNEELWGKTLNGVTIIDPNKICELYYDPIIIVANALHYEEIETQLLKLGVPKERITVFK